MIELPYNFQNLDTSNLPNATDSDGDVIGKAVPASYLDANFQKLAQVVHVGTSPPSSPYEGMVWLDTVNGVIKQYDGTQWVSKVNLANTATNAVNATNADTVDNYHASQTPTANTIPVAGSDGKLASGWLPQVIDSTILSIYPFNGSFEIDSDNDGVPDGWTVTLYNGGSAGFETTNVAHGNRAYKFVHPGGSGNGGGYLESDYIPISFGTKLSNLSFLVYVTASGLKVEVVYIFYDKNKNFISEQTMLSYSSFDSHGWYEVNVNTGSYFIQPTNATYFKIRLIGGKNDASVGGTVIFDSVEYDPPVTSRAYCYVSNNINQGEVSTSSISYVDVGSAWTVTLPYKTGTLVVQAQIKGNTYCRFRIGSLYSNEATTSSSDYVTVNLSLTYSGIIGDQTLIFQLKIDGSVGNAYLKSPSGLLRYFTIRSYSVTV